MQTQFQVNLTISADLGPGCQEAVRLYAERRTLSMVRSIDGQATVTATAVEP